MNGLIFSSNFIWLTSIVLTLSNLEEKFKQLKMKTDTEIKDLNIVSGILSIEWIRDEEIEYVFLSAWTELQKKNNRLQKTMAVPFYHRLEQTILLH